LKELRRGSAPPALGARLLEIRRGPQVKHSGALADLIEVLRRSDELKTTLLALVGHELQTPLTVIKTTASSLHQDGTFDRAAVVTLTQVIDREADRLHHMVSNLLDLSRIDGGALHLALDWYDLGELTREAVDRLRAAIGDQPVEVDVDEELPPIRVDYLLFDRVVANLVLNAVRYAPSEAPIRVAVERRRDEIQLRVTERGRAIALTPTEYAILKALAERAGQVLTHRTLLQAVWGPVYGTEDYYLHVYIGRLRRKIEPDPARPRYLITEPGAGYRLQLDPSEDRAASGGS
jgi:signal transduction histidine kinase